MATYVDDRLPIVGTDNSDKISPLEKIVIVAILSYGDGLINPEISDLADSQTVITLAGLIRILDDLGYQTKYIPAEKPQSTQQDYPIFTYPLELTYYVTQGGIMHVIDLIDAADLESFNRIHHKNDDYSAQNS